MEKTSGKPPPSRLKWKYIGVDAGTFRKLDLLRKRHENRMKMGRLAWRHFMAFVAGKLS